MARLVGSGNIENFGENFFIEKMKEYLDDTNIIYWNRQLLGREFDVCLLMPEKGILVVELKGWREENVLRVDNSDKIIINTPNGEEASSPQKQARGYRFSISRFIRQSIEKKPLVFQMVCLPQISKAFYRTKRLDVVTEEKFTILKEDLYSKVTFFNKLDQALREVSNWFREPFDNRTMLEVRNLFETNIDLENSEQTENIKEVFSKEHDYSRFYYFSDKDNIESSILEDMSKQYLKGTKLYCVVSSNEMMKSIVSAIDSELKKKGLLRSKDSIRITFEDGENHYPNIDSITNTFLGFNLSISVISDIHEIDVNDFIIVNGQATEKQLNVLHTISDLSQFNLGQYLIEHTNPGKNIVIRAGAGTGKTYTMISRIGYICYSQNIPLSKMIERIVMITFTNDTADQMEEKIKQYFKNMYLITSNVEYFKVITAIDNMQISTIHSYAKWLISQLGTSFGYGIDLGITSSEYHRRKKISDILDSYIQSKEREYGKTYSEKLGMPVYAIRDSILDFISKLHNKSVDIASIETEAFGELESGEDRTSLHELLAYIIPEVEREFNCELLESNKIHLSSMMSVLNKFINSRDSTERIMSLKKDPNAMQFLFVDEFQDTDDTQIESILILSELIGYKMFLVGDIKQCIYRFRGAKEKAFDKLSIEKEPDKWIEYSLQRNYRTDSMLLDIFDKSFSAWGECEDELLTYNKNKDRLLGSKQYNDYLKNHPEKFYTEITVDTEELRIPRLIEEIKRLQKRIEFEQNRGDIISKKEKSIAILVRENWQAEMVKTECAKFGISIHTNTGGDLYMSQPALDMMTLINGLLYFDEAEHLYALISSNFFNIDIPKSNLYKIREKIRKGGWRTKTDEREQVNYLISFMNLLLANTVDKNNKWELIVSSLRTMPILQVIRKIYSTLQPWKNYSDDPWKQHYYQLNVDLLFEQLINGCNVDKLTINTLQEYLYNAIVSKTSVDSRIPDTDEADVSIQCITVHKSKGLEYGHVILPFCSNAIDYVKKAQMHISTTNIGDKLHIGYSLSLKETGETIRNNYYDEIIEKAEKAREETRILYVAMTRAIRSFSWIAVEGKKSVSWQNLITEVK